MRLWFFIVCRVSIACGPPPRAHGDDDQTLQNTRPVHIGSMASPGLPPLPGSEIHDKPHGAPGKLRVLNWAGFASANSWTFDDAQPSHIEHYSELVAMGERLTFYITTGNAQGADSDAAWSKAVRDGHELGNHSVHHCHADLTGCPGGSPLPTLADEIDQASAYIKEHFSQPDVWTSASPCGDSGYEHPYSERFFVNRGIGSGFIAPNDDTDPFNLPCHVAAAGEKAISFERAIDAARDAKAWLILLVHTIQPTTANWYNPVDIRAITKSIAHAQLDSDVWIDSVVNIGAYWRGQTIVSNVKPSQNGATTTWAWSLPPHFPPGKVLRVTVDGGTLTQNGQALAWDSHGYYEIALNAGTLTLSP